MTPNQEPQPTGFSLRLLPSAELGPPQNRLVVDGCICGSFSAAGPSSCKRHVRSGAAVSPMQFNHGFNLTPEISGPAKPGKLSCGAG